MDERQTATVLAALRHYQKTWSEHTRITDKHFTDRVTPLTDSEIDELCEDINTRNVYFVD